MTRQPRSYILYPGDYFTVETPPITPRAHAAYAALGEAVTMKEEEPLPAPTPGRPWYIAPDGTPTPVPTVSTGPEPEPPNPETSTLPSDVISHPEDRTS